MPHAALKSALSTGRREKSFEFTGRHMLAIMVTFFGVVISVNILMATLATSTWTGLLAKNGYVASIDYAKDEESRAAALTRGWAVKTRILGRLLAVDAADRAGAPLALPLTAEARPADPRAPAVSLGLQPTETGARSEDALAPGDWTISLVVGSGDDALLWRTHVTILP